MRDKKLGVISFVLIFLLLFLAGADLASAGNNARREIQYNKRKLDLANREKRLFSDMLSKTDRWFFMVGFYVPAAVDKREAIELITMKYYRDLVNTGKPFSKNELASRIKKFRDQDRAIRKQMRQKLSSLNSEIPRLKRKIARLTAKPSRKPSPRKSQVTTGRSVRVPHWNWNLPQGERIEYRIVCRYMSRHNPGQQIARVVLRAANARDLADTFRNRNNFIDKSYNTQVTITAIEKTSHGDRKLAVKKGSHVW